MAWPDEAFRFPTDATTAYFVTDVYGSKIINHVRANLVAVATCDIDWRTELYKGKKLWIPVLTTLSATDVDPQVSFIGDGVTTAERAFGTTPTSITVDKWKENPVMIDDSTKLQSNVPALLEKAANNAAYGLLKAIDTTVNTLYSSLTTTWQGTDGQTFSDDILISLMEGLDEADVPRQERALIGDPSMVADIYKIDKYMSRDYGEKTFTTDAFRGRINMYDLPVFVTNNLVDAGTGNRGALLQKEAIGVIIQSEPKVEAFRVAWRHSDCINVSAFYGAGVVRSTFGACFYTRYN